MTISELIQSTRIQLSLAAGSGDTEITGVEYDSRKAASGSIFVAVEGFDVDGHEYIEAALKNGASALLVSKSRADEFKKYAGQNVSVLSCDDTRRGLSVCAAAFFGHPSSDMTVIGVTGTNGKTSITYMLESIFAANGNNPGVIGTVNYRWNGNVISAPNTTPESRDVQEIFWRMKSAGVDVVIMEVSSHGLHLGRVDDVEFNCGIFTNLTRDHLDYHKTFDEYFAAKKILFSLIENSPKQKRAALINADDEYGRSVLAESANFSYAVKGYACMRPADYSAQTGTVKNAIEGISYRINFDSSSADIDLHVAGMFHVYNSMAAFSAAHQMGVAPDVCIKGLAALETIPGRFDRVASNQGFFAIVDYAHTDDALRKLLESARGLNPARIITVFGCGGNRDKTKRPLMGSAAQELSDIAIVTSDNPRKEEPLAIIEDILAGMDRARCIVEPDREKAIARAVAEAKRGDLIVLAGKGHEDYQIVGTVKHHFDDREVVRKYIDMRMQ